MKTDIISYDLVPNDNQLFLAFPLPWKKFMAGNNDGMIEGHARGESFNVLW